MATTDQLMPLVLTPSHDHVSDAGRVVGPNPEAVQDGCPTLPSHTVAGCRACPSAGDDGSAVAGRPVSDVWPGAPVSPGVVFPAGTHADPAGLLLSDTDRPTAPLVITGRRTDDTTKLVEMEVAFRLGRCWTQQWVPRKTLATKSGVVELSGYGFPVNAFNSAEVVAYLTAFEMANHSVIGAVRVTGHTGWHDGLAQFALGRTTLRQTNAATPVQFRGVDRGYDRLVEGYRTAGTLAGWCEIAERARAHPVCWFMMQTAFVPPLLEVLKAPSFVVDLAGPTSTGKSSALALCGSVWGGEHIVSSWNSRPAFRDRVTGVIRDLPLLFDDTKTAGDAAAVAHLAYSITQGVGRGRGTAKGVAESASVRTVLISTGEQAIVDRSKDGGLRGRVVTLTGRPFGDVTAAASATVRVLKDMARQHHGHAGRTLLQYLLDHPHEHGRWRDVYHGLAAEYRQRAVGNNLLDRLADPLAAVATASQVAHTALGLSGEWTDPVLPLWQDLAGPTVADAATEAYLAAYDAAVIHRGHFSTAARPAAAGAGWWGRWDHPTATAARPGGATPTGGGVVCYFPDRLRKVLAAAGHDLDEVKPVWKQRAWLRTDVDGRDTYRISIGDQKVRVIALRLDVVGDLQNRPRVE